MSSRNPTPLPSGAEEVRTHNIATKKSAQKSVPAGHTSVTASARTAPSTNDAELNHTNNVTFASHSPQWPPIDRQSTQQPARTGQVPRGTSTSTSRSPSTAASPYSSRDSSPAGRLFRQQSVPGTTSAAGMRNSQEVSPHRPPSITGHNTSVPSAAAIQRALSAATTPQLQPTTSSSTLDAASRVPRPVRGGTTSSTPGESNTPSWPISPRLKSPPPSASRRNSLKSQKKSDAPNIIIQSATPTSSTTNLPLIDSSLEQDQRHPPQSSKPSTRGASGAPALETVQESSGPNTPGNGLSSFSSDDRIQKYFDMPEEKAQTGATTPRRSMAAPANKSLRTNNSDSDGAEKKPELKKSQETDTDATPRPKAPSTRASYSSLRNVKSTGGMTVETETVNSVAQSTIGAPSDRSSSRADHGGTLRTKASNDTIKPSKSRKKAARKAPSITATGGSTRADIFEDRVKNAMDEETSDDSDETFVYESNPAEPPIRRSRHHSRTPSGASLTSMGGQDRRQGQGMLNTQKTRSMKFANAYNSADDDGMDRIDGIVRGNTGTRGSAVHHHHTGRPSRSTTGHASILDDDSPFPQLNKVRSLTGLPNRSTQNARLAARNLHASNQNGNVDASSNGNTRKNNGYMSYDLDADGGDDERTPLISNTGTIRTPRTIRRPPTRGSRTEHRYSRRRSGMLTRFAGFVAIIAMLFLLVFGIVGFLFIITTPLQDVQLYELYGTIVSETELMFDMKVGAINPNLLAITVTDVDLNIFARSKYVGSEKWWREHATGDWTDISPASLPTSDRKEIRPIDAQQNLLPDIPGSWLGDNEDDDDRKDPDTNTTMLLGRVLHIDVPLAFDPSFLKRHVHNATTAVRLSKPGNHTELGGTARWERVVKHEFDLIVRGTLKYTIPLGGRAYATNVGARITIDPSKNDGDSGGEKKPKDDGADGRLNQTTIQFQEPPKSAIKLLDEADTVLGRLKNRAFARALRLS